jgi:hypothetical protein
MLSLHLGKLAVWLVEGNPKCDCLFGATVYNFVGHFCHMLQIYPGALMRWLHKHEDVTTTSLKSNGVTLCFEETGFKYVSFLCKLRIDSMGSLI